MKDIVWLSPTWTTVFILAVLTLFVTLFWDNIKRVFTNNDKQKESESHWSKFNNFVSANLAITIARYFLSIAVLSVGIYFLASVNSAVCGTTFLILGVVTFIVGIPFFACVDFQRGDVQKIFVVAILFVQFILAVLLFIYGAGTFGFYVIALMGFNTIILPKHMWFKRNR